MKSKLMLAAAALWLAGCGGASDPPPLAEDRPVPASATSSPTAYAEFVGSRPEENALEPMAVQGLLPPTSEDDEPLPLR